MSPLTLVPMNGSHIRPAAMNGSTANPADQDWLQFSVREFFSQLNWDDHPLNLQALDLDPINPQPLSLEMSVSYYFSAIDWEGRAIAAPISISELPSAPSDDLTLDDFSSLF